MTTTSDSFATRVAQSDLRPLWLERGLLTEVPRSDAVPHVWPYSTVLDLLREASQSTMAEIGERRVLAYANPGLGGAPYATPTLWGAVQYLLPGETAPAHRHTPGALRFVLEGAGVWTLVGREEPIAMSPGDLVITPARAWHSHHARGDGPMAWFDGLDLPLVRYLGAIFFEGGGQRPDFTDESARTGSEIRHSGPGLSIESMVNGEAVSNVSLLAYRWAATDAALDDAIATSGCGWAIARFTDPTSGGDIMPTLRAQMLRVTPGAEADLGRIVGSRLAVVFGGSGTVVLDGNVTLVGRGDGIAVPTWTDWGIRADVETVDVFVLSDAPVLEALGLAKPPGW